MNKDRISELENKIAEAFKAGNRARKKESAQDMSGMSERYPDEPDPEADKGSQLDTEPMFNRLRDWMTKLGWSVSEGDIHYFTIKMDSGDPVLGEIEADISTDIGYSKTRGYNLDFYLEFRYWPWEVSWYQFCARFIPGMSYRNEAFLDWNGFCRFITDLTILLRNPGFAETVRKFASNYMVAVLKRGISNSDYILSILFQEILRDKFGFDFVSDKFRYTLYKSTMMDSHQKAYYELLNQAHAIGACINWDPDPKVLKGFRQQRIADMEGGKSVNEAFRAGNRARKKESAQDAVESVDDMQVQIEMFKEQTGIELEIRDGRPYFDGYLYLGDRAGLTDLPAGLRVGNDLYLADCTGLTSLPVGLEVGGDLNLRGCTGLTSLPDGLKVGGQLHLEGCTGLTRLPDGLEVGGRLILIGCAGLTGLPSDLVVQGGWIVHDGILTPFFRKLGIPVDEDGDTRTLYWREWQESHGYLTEAFKAGNRARRKKSAQDAVESPDTLLQKFLMYFSEDAFKTITGCGVYNYSVKVTSSESFRINCIQTTDSEGDGLPYGEVELIIDLTNFTFDGKWYNLSGEMAWKDADGTPNQYWDSEQQDFTNKENFGVKCQTLFALAKNAWMKIGIWIEFGSNAHAEPHEWYFDEKIREVMRNDGIEMDEPAEVGEAFRAGNRARKKESAADTVESVSGDRIFKDFDDFKTVAERLLRSTGLEMNTKIELLPDTKNWYGLTVDLNDDNKPYDISLVFKFVNIGRGDGLMAVGDEAEKAKELPGFNEALHNGIERFDILFHGDISPNDLLDATGIRYRLTVMNDWRGFKPDPMFMPVVGWNTNNPDVPINYAVLTYSMLKALVDNIIVPLARGYHDSTDLKDRLDTFRLSVMSRVNRELEAPKKPEGPGSGTWRHDKDDLLKSVRRLLKKDGLFRFRAVIDSVLACNGRLEKDSRQEYVNPYGRNYLTPDDKKFFQDLETEYYGLFKDRKPFDVCL